MMIAGALVVDAVVPFSTMSSDGIDSSPYRISLCGSTHERVSALVRLDRRPTSETDVVVATGEIVTRVGLVFSRWELRQRHDDALVAGADMSPIAVRPFAPFPCVVRLFGSELEIPTRWIRV
jgi:hypothetical protein